VNVNDLSTAQLETIVRFRREFADVTVWPSAEFGIVLLHTNSAGIERVSRVFRNGHTDPVSVVAAISATRA
jgi:hypothetical protein